MAEITPVSDNSHNKGLVRCARGRCPFARQLRHSTYCNGFAGVPGLTPECFFACAINSRTLALPS